METSLKPGFAQIFSCCPKNLSCPKFGGAAAPLAPPARLFWFLNLKIASSFFPDMMEAMKSIVVMSQVLETEERNMLSVAYKNVIGARRAAWRIFAGLEQKYSDNAKQSDMVKGYKEKIEKEIHEISDGILDLLDKYLIPSAETDESKVFFYKM